MSTLLRLARNLPHRDETEKGSIEIKQLKATLDEDYLRRILNSYCDCPAHFEG